MNQRIHRLLGHLLLVGIAFLFFGAAWIVYAILASSWEIPQDWKMKARIAACNSSYDTPNPIHPISLAFASTFACSGFGKFIRISSKEKIFLKRKIFHLKLLGLVSQKLFVFLDGGKVHSKKKSFVH